jgi:hypothetical protein
MDYLTKEVHNFALNKPSISDLLYQTLQESHFLFEDISDDFEFQDDIQIDLAVNYELQ